MGDRKNTGLPGAKHPTDWNRLEKQMQNAPIKLIKLLVIVEGDVPLEVEQTSVVRLRKILASNREPRAGDRIILHYDMDSWEEVTARVKKVCGSLNRSDPYAFAVFVELDNARAMYPLLCALHDWEKLPVKTKTPKEISEALKERGPLPHLPVIRGRIPDIVIDPSDQHDNLGGVVPDGIVET